MTQRWGAWDAAAMFALVTTTALRGVPAVTSPLASPDENLLLEYPDKIRQGAIPNVDFYTPYANVGFDFLNGWYALFGYSPTAERLAGLGYQIGIVLGMWLLTRQRGRHVAFLSALLSLVLMPNSVMAFAWMGGLALAVWALALVSWPAARSGWMAGGALAGLSVGWRYEMALVVGLPLLALIWGHARAKWVLAGAVVGLLPVGAHALRARGAVWDNVTGRAGVNFQLDPGAVGAYAWLGLAVMALAVGGLVVHAFSSRSREAASWALVALALTPQTLQRIDSYHVAFAAIVILPLALAVTLNVAKTRERPRRSKTRLFVAVLLIPALVGLFVWLVSSGSPNETQTVTSGSRSVRVPSDQASNLKALLLDVHTRVPKGSRLFAGTDQMGRTSFNRYPIYYLLSDEYRFDSYYLELAAGVAERDGSGLSNDIRNADALILMTFDPAVGDTLFPNAPTGFTEHDRTVRDHFAEISRHGDLVLYLKRK